MEVFLSLIHIFTDRYFGYQKALLELGLEQKKEWVLDDRHIETGKIDTVNMSVSYTHLDVYKRQAKSIMKSFTEEYPISIVASTQRIVHLSLIHI